MTILEKPFLDIDMQVKKLIDRGLIIESLEETKRILLKTTYYDVINGYKDIFLVEKSNDDEEDKFLPNTKFNDLLILYKLDKNIRNFIFNSVLEVECNFYSALSYCISEKYGEKYEVYLNKDNYKAGKIQAYNKKSERENLLWKINKKIRDAEEQPLKYYIKKYGNVPPWILVKSLTFGELLVLYKLSSADIKENVIKILLGTTPTEEEKEFFVKSMELFNKFRNRAAHGGRMYNYKTNIEIPYRKWLFDLLGITKEQYNSGVGKSDNGAFMLALLNFHKNDAQRLYEFIVYLNYDLKRYIEKQPIHATNIFKYLGIPFDFYDKVTTCLSYGILKT
ncbi:Abi family protein [Lysinibacillus sp. VIII_CA]|uniref:Abi family protein n=1 Tax=Lysinibacillus sp. VIII_CA TaxID=3417452 RepID=UPI003CF75F97